MGSVSIPAQEWPIKPGPREITVYLRYPGAGAKIEGVRPGTGLMLSLHNWGGTASGGSADVGVLSNKYNVVAIGVDGSPRAAEPGTRTSGAGFTRRSVIQ